MFKNESLWAVYAVLKQHYSNLAVGKTNKASNIVTAVLVYYYVAVSCIIKHAVLYQACVQSDISFSLLGI